MPVLRKLTMRDLIPVGRTSSNAIQYPSRRPASPTRPRPCRKRAAPTKPQSDIQFDLVTTSVTTIAHWVLATRQILDDVPMLQSYIDGRLRYGLGYVEDNQLLNGAGTGTDLNGVYTQATASTANLRGWHDRRRPSTCFARRCCRRPGQLSPDGIVLNPTDWA
jgi:HK97 family phage major capsid protein